MAFARVDCSAADLQMAFARVDCSVADLYMAFAGVGSGVADLQTTYAGVGCGAGDLQITFAGVGSAVADAGEVAASAAVAGWDLDHGAAPLALLAADDTERFAADALLSVAAVAGSQMSPVVPVVYGLTPYANDSFHWNHPKMEPPSQQQKTTHSKYSGHNPQQPPMSG